MADTGIAQPMRGRIKAALKAMPGVMVTNGDAHGALDLILATSMGCYAEAGREDGRRGTEQGAAASWQVIRNSGAASAVGSVARA